MPSSCVFTDPILSAPPSRLGAQRGAPWAASPLAVLLALLLLPAVVGVPSAHAQYAERTGPDNPFDGVTATSTPAAVDAIAGDFDTDGDVDLFAYDGAAERFYANDGSGAFAEATGSANPFDGLSPAFATRGRTFVRDVDADGDLDVVIFDYTGAGSGALVYLENTDGATYAVRSGSDNPFDGIAVRGTPATVDAVMGDVDGDGDPDLLAFDGSQERYYENDPSGAVPIFTERTGPDNPFDGILPAMWTKTTTLVEDLDGDGDVDVAARTGTGGATDWIYLENTGGSFALRTGTSNPLRTVAADATPQSLAAVAGDFDLDGALELLTISGGTQRTYDRDGTGTFAEVTADDPFATAEPSLGVKATTVVADVDGDGDADLVFSDPTSNALRYVERTGSPPADLQITGGGADGLDFSGQVAAGTQNNAVGLFQLVADKSGAVLEAVTITNTAPGVAGITAARLFRSSDASFDAGADTEIGSVAVTSTAAEETFGFGGLGQAIPVQGQADGGFVFLTIDVEAGAPPEAVRFNIESDADLQVGGGTIATVNGESASGFSLLQLSNGSTVLPVELARFEATAGDDGVVLEWTTVSETGNAGFDVQRRNGPGAGPQTERWTTVGSLPGAGTTSEPQRYRFEDTGVPFAADSLTYRLRQIDESGAVSFPTTITVARPAVEAVQLLGVYPNPSRWAATVRYALPNGEADAVQMRLYDVLGREVRRVEVSATAGRHAVQLSVAGLPAGLYFLRLRAGAAVETQRLTVVR